MLRDTAAPVDIAALEPPPSYEDTPAVPQLVAVYGTLKQGMSNHGLMNHLEFYGNDVTEAADYLMVGGRGFPYVHKGGSERIAVELYAFESISDIAMLDALERHPSWYRRELVLMDSGVTAWMYLQPEFTDGRTSDDVTRVRVTHTDGISTWS